MPVCLLRLPKRGFARWQSRGSYDPLHIPKAHKCVTLLDAAASDFPTAAAVIFTDDIHFKRSRHILELAGHPPPLPEHYTRVLAAAKQFELKTCTNDVRVALLEMCAEAEKIPGINVDHWPWQGHSLNLNQRGFSGDWLLGPYGWSGRNHH